MKDLNIGGKYSFADFGYFSLGVYNFYSLFIHFIHRTHLFLLI